MPNRPHRIIIYNHKGGVGKTTLTFHIASALAALNKKVLLVDTDPQCNLTSFLLDDEVVNDLLDRSDGPSGKTIWSSVKPIWDQSGDVRLIDPQVVGSLSLIPGDILLSRFEELLGEAWTHCFQRRLGGFHAMGAISELVDSVSAVRSFDFVFYDAGPNIGPLNRALLLDSDAFIVPVACDLFSKRALKMLGQKLKEWIVDWRTAASLAPDRTSLLSGAPRFIGYIPQRFKVYGKVMAREPTFYLGALKRRMHDDITAILTQVDPDLVPIAQKDFLLGEVKDYPSLVQTAQREGVPIWDCSSTDTHQKELARVAFKKIAENLIARCKLLESV